MEKAEAADQPELAVITENVDSVATGALAIGVFEDEKVADGSGAATVDQALSGLISRLISEGEITGKPDSVTVIHTPREIAADRVLLVGLGKRSDLTAETVRRAGATAARKANELKIRHMAAVPPAVDHGQLATPVGAQAFSEGVLLGSYRFQAYGNGSEDDEPAVESVGLLASRGREVSQLQQGLERGGQIAAGVNLARDLGNRPANRLTPAQLAEEAERVAAAVDLECRVFDGGELESMGMGALLGVAAGSRQPPRLIVLTYEGDGGDPLALVGKGITFDSGGTSIKQAGGMEEMKYDMCGAAAVLGAMQVTGQLKPAQKVVGVIPAAENMPGGAALKPGDVLDTFSGKSIEIINTDAEGRLILADAVAYAERELGAKRLVDVATLTGAAITALGHVAAPLMSDDEVLCRELESAAARAGEKVWRLPVYEEYKEQLKSEVADLTNLGKKGAGSITAALVVRSFIEDAAWAHLDIAGTAWDLHKTPYAETGASGFGVRTFVELIDPTTAESP